MCVLSEFNLQKIIIFFIHIQFSWNKWW